MQQHDIWNEIKDIITQTGRLHAKVAVIPDKLFNNAIEEAKLNDPFGTIATGSYEVFFENRIRLVSESEAGRMLEVYYKILSIIPAMG